MTEEPRRYLGIAPLKNEGRGPGGAPTEVIELIAEAFKRRRNGKQIVPRDVGAAIRLFGELKRLGFEERP